MIRLRRFGTDRFDRLPRSLGLSSTIQRLRQIRRLRLLVSLGLLLYRLVRTVRIVVRYRFVFIISFIVLIAHRVVPPFIPQNIARLRRDVGKAIANKLTRYIIYP